MKRLKGTIGRKTGQRIESPKTAKPAPPKNDGRDSFYGTSPIVFSGRSSSVDTILQKERGQTATAATTTTTTTTEATTGAPEPSPDLTMAESQEALFFNGSETTTRPKRSRVVVGMDLDMMKELGVLPKEEEKEEEEIPPEKLGRLHIIGEMLHTEQVYVKDLEYLLKNIIGPIEEKKLLSKRDRETIFCNIEDIFNLHVSILQKLTERMRITNVKRGPEALPGKGGSARGHVVMDDMTVRTASVRVADIFTERQSDFGVYVLYCCNFKKSMDAVTRCRTDALFSKFLEDAGGIVLRDFLIKPVQRICKYPLLFNSLLRCTNEREHDYKSLQASVKIMEDLVMNLNLAREEAENIHFLLQIEKNMTGFKGKIATPERQFKRKGKLIKYSKGDKGHAQLRVCFLFNDCFMFAKLKGKKYNFKGVIPNRGACVVDVPDGTFSQNHAFLIARKDDTHRYRFHAPSAESKRRWVMRLSKIMKPIEYDSQLAEKQRVGSTVAKERSIESITSPPSLSPRPSEGIVLRRDLPVNVETTLDKALNESLRRQAEMLVKIREENEQLKKQVHSMTEEISQLRQEKAQMAQKIKQLESSKEDSDRRVDAAPKTAPVRGGSQRGLRASNGRSRARGGGATMGGKRGRLKDRHKGSHPVRPHKGTSTTSGKVLYGTEKPRKRDEASLFKEFFSENEKEETEPAESSPRNRSATSAGGGEEINLFSYLVEQNTPETGKSSDTIKQERRVVTINAKSAEGLLEILNFYGQQEK